MSHRGYVVTPALLPALAEELEAIGVPFLVVETPTGLGDPVRPVLVSSDPSPKGWTRFGVCKKCRKFPSGLMQDGRVRAWCESCTEERDGTVTAEEVWQQIEGLPVGRLRLPKWISQLDVVTVGQARALLASGELRQVGPERAAIVSEALADFRKRVLEAIA